MKDTIDDMMPPRSLPRPSRSFHVRYMSVFCLMKYSSDLLPLLEALNDGRKNNEELGNSHLEREVLHGTRGNFVVMLIEAAYPDINNRTNPPTFHALVFSRLGEQSLQTLFDLIDEFDILPTLSFLEFMNEKLAEALDEGNPIKQFYLDNMQLFEYDPRDQKKRWAERVAALKKRLVS